MAEKDSLTDNLNKDLDIDIDLSDFDDISLEELDGFEGIDFDNLELDDIDFDDLDVTSLDSGIGSSHEKTKQESEDDFDFESLLAEEEKKNSGIKQDSTPIPEDLQDTGPTSDIDDLMKEIEMDTYNDVFDDADKKLEEDTGELSNEDLDALFSSLGIEDDTSHDSNDEDYLKNSDELDDLFQQSMELSLEDGDLDDIQDISEVKSAKRKKSSKNKSGDKNRKTMSEILFGEPDEDDEEEERYLAEKKAQKEIKKAEKSEQKAVKKEEKNRKKQETLAVKQKENQGKAKAKADKKAAKEAEYKAELEAEKDAKKVPTFVVIVVFAAFAALAVFVILGTKNFDYQRVIDKATEYFDRQRYRLAYDEIAGVEVKEKDEDLKDRIYTVMYVERLYESYENNMKLDRPDKALDALIRGLEKYDEHYEEAVELNIVSDIDNCKQKIISALWTTYSMSQEEAYVVMGLEGHEYTAALDSYCSGLASLGE